MRSRCRRPRCACRLDAVAPTLGGMVGPATERRSRRRRGQIALAFETVLRDVLRPPRAFTARAPVDPRQVLDAQPEIEQLVARLRDERRRVDGGALLMAEELLCDVHGPLFALSASGALMGRVRLIRIAMG